MTTNNIYKINDHHTTLAFWWGVPGGVALGTDMDCFKDSTGTQLLHHAPGVIPSHTHQVGELNAKFRNNFIILSVEFSSCTILPSICIIFKTVPRLLQLNPLTLTQRGAFRHSAWCSGHSEGWWRSGSPSAGTESCGTTVQHPEHPVPWNTRYQTRKVQEKTASKTNTNWTLE